MGTTWEPHGNSPALGTLAKMLMIKCLTETHGIVMHCPLFFHWLVTVLRWVRIPSSIHTIPYLSIPFTPQEGTHSAGTSIITMVHVEYCWIVLNSVEYCWILLNIVECLEVWLILIQNPKLPGPPWQAYSAEFTETRHWKNLLEAEAPQKTVSQQATTGSSQAIITVFRSPTGFFMSRYGSKSSYDIPLKGGSTSKVPAGLMFSRIRVPRSWPNAGGAWTSCEDWWITHRCASGPKTVCPGHQLKVKREQKTRESEASFRIDWSASLPHCMSKLHQTTT